MIEGLTKFFKGFGSPLDVAPAADFRPLNERSLSESHEKGLVEIRSVPPVNPASETIFNAIRGGQQA